MLVDTVHAWDGIGSSVVGGLIGGATVAGGLWWARREEDRKRFRDLHDRAVQARLDASRQLIVQVNNTRDHAVVRVPRGDDFALWPLRQALLLSERDLGPMPAYWETQAFLETVGQFRSWARAHPRQRRDDTTNRAVAQYCDELRRYGDRLIEMLQRDYENPEARIAGGERLPVLPL